MTGAGWYSDGSRRTDRRIALAREWDALADEIRRIEGFEEFLRPPPLATLLDAAAGGPVIIINVSQWRSDALVVTTQGFRAVPLPRLTASDVRARAKEYLEALNDKPTAGTAAADIASFAERMRARAASRSHREEILRATMEWLWDAVAAPVLTVLGFDTPSSNDPPRVWWCPTGLLTMLPVHGAGYHGTGDGRTVLDRVVSSYTPTLRALDVAQRPLPDAAGERSFAFVGVPHAPDAVYLGDDIARERAAVARAFPHGLEVLEGVDATVATVAAALSRHRWVHVSCHGYQNIFDPTRAGLMLTDGTLTIRSISAARHHGEFAFLSACMTATGGVNLPDEAITLAAALNYTGYRHVVATLWKVPSSTAADVTEAVYPQLTADGSFEPDRVAVALHRAVRDLRNRGARMSDWLPFVHNGP